MSRVFLDAALRRPMSTTGMDLATAALTRAWADPTAGHHEGKQADALLRQATMDTAGLLGARQVTWSPSEEAALVGGLAHLAAQVGARSVATTAVDRLLVQQAVQMGPAESVILPVDPVGRLALRALADLPTPAVVAVQAGNTEVGTLQPLDELATWADRTGSALLIDASAAVGWVDITQGWHALVADPRAWGGMPGAVITAWNTPPVSAPVDPNVPAIVVAAATLAMWLRTAPAAAVTARGQVDWLRSLILGADADVVVHGDPALRLPHIVSLSALYVDGEALQTALDTDGFAVGSGSACAAANGQPSHVLAAIGGLTSGNIRVGLPPDVRHADVQRFAGAVLGAVAEIRERFGGEGL